MKRSFLFLCGLLASCMALAAPQKVSAVYEATRNGQPFATVTESYRQEGNHYRIESVTKGIGVYALFGVRRLASEGEVTADGLKPSRFEQQQGDKKPVVAEFDWDAGKLTMTNKNKTTTVDLEAGTQDLASFSYQFMFREPTGDEVIMPVTTGKRLRSYQYRISARGEGLDGVLGGGLKTVHLANVVTDAGGEEKEFWLASERHYIPARIVFRDENGAGIEQVLTSLSFE
jgi:hypothetical protein